MDYIAINQTIPKHHPARGSTIPCASSPSIVRSAPPQSSAFAARVEVPTEMHPLDSSLAGSTAVGVLVVAVVAAAAAVASTVEVVAAAVKTAGVGVVVVVAAAAAAGMMSQSPEQTVPRSVSASCWPNSSLCRGLGMAQTRCRGQKAQWSRHQLVLLGVRTVQPVQGYVRGSSQRWYDLLSRSDCSFGYDGTFRRVEIAVLQHGCSSLRHCLSWQAHWAGSWSDR